VQLNRDLILDTAFDILSAYGLGDLSMRRLAKGLEVAPGALYWHFPSKQVLLGAVADRILQGPSPHENLVGESVESTDAATQINFSWRDRAAAAAATLLDQLLSTRDGAEIVSAALATKTLGQDPVASVSKALTGAPGSDPELVAWVVVRYLLGAATELQTAHAADTDPGLSDRLGTERILAGVDLILAGAGSSTAASTTVSTSASSSVSEEPRNSGEPHP